MLTQPVKELEKTARQIRRDIHRHPELGFEETRTQALVRAWLEERGYDGAFDMQRRAEEVPVYEYVALAQQLGAALPTPAH